MKIIGFIGLLFIGCNAFLQTDTAAYGEMLKSYYKYTVPLIQPETLYSKLKNGEKVHLLDARENSEYEVSTISGAVHVGFLFFSKKRVKSINKDELVVVYCTIGARSETIGARLLKNDYKQVYNLYGGIIHWKNLGYPVYKNDVETTQVHVYSKKWGQWLTQGKATY